MTDAPTRSTVLRHRLRDGRFGSAQALRQATGLVEQVLGEVVHTSEHVDIRDWRPTAASWTATGTATFPVGPVGGPPRAVLRLTSTGAGRLRRESEVLAEFANSPALAGLRELVPARLGEGACGGWWYVLDQYIAGVDAPAAVAAEPGLRAGVHEEAARTVTELHRATAVPVELDDDLLTRWIDEPVAVLAATLRRSPVRVGDRLDRVRNRLHGRLAGRRVHAGWIHGDYWLGNVRVTPDTGRAVGVIDWDCAGSRELPAHDLLHLALFGRSVERGQSLGSVIAEVLTAGSWPAECEELVGRGRWAWGALADSDVALLYWLRYMAAMTTQQQDYVDHSVLVWRLRNIVPVLRCL